MSITETIPTAPGTPFAGGFYAGQIRTAGQLFALIVAPKAEGEHKNTIWIDDYKEVAAARSYFDGMANTKAMATAGSALAQWALDLRIGDHDDWYLPSQDELEIIYRALKPTTRENSGYARSGINLSAAEPTRPYTPQLPAQTSAVAFQEGAAQAFDSTWYWSSTQHASGSDYAWCQYFDGGGQGDYGTDDALRARAVRRLIIQ